MTAAQCISQLWRMTLRWMVRLLTLGSWALLILAITMAIRTRSYADHLSYQWMTERNGNATLGNVRVTSVDGSVLISWFRINTKMSFAGFLNHTAPFTYRLGWAYRNNPAPAGSSLTGNFEFGTAYLSGDRDQPEIVAKIPWWAIALISVPLVFQSAYLPARRTRRKSTGLCVHCGYDLRATPDRCPECGAFLSQGRPQK